jgi:hypothetical protein
MRRELLGIIIYLFINLFAFNYFQNKSIFYAFFKLFNLRILLLIAVFVISLWFIIPTHVASTFLAIYDALHILVYGETLLGIEETRIGFTGTKDIITAIKLNPFFGTGFHPDWYDGHSTTMEWKGSDFIFLSTIGMYGFVGLILFIRFYIFAIKYIIRLLKLIKNYFYPTRTVDTRLIYAVVVSLAASSEIIRNLLEYPNWFLPIGATFQSPALFIYFGLLIGSYNFLTLRSQIES